MAGLGRKPRCGGRRSAIGHEAADFVPLYYKIYVVLQQRLRDGEWPPGKPMPTEQDLAVKYDVSRVTVRKALAMLEQEKLILRQPGRGTFAVPSARSSRRANFSGLLENTVDFERHTQVRLLAFDKVALPAPVAARLELPPGSPGLKIARVRSDKKAPFSFSECYLPETVAALIDRETLGNRTVLTALIAAGVRASTAEQSLSATVADVELARSLRVEVGSPLISMARVVRDHGGRPIEYIRTLYRPDKYEYRVSLSRDQRTDAPHWKAMA